MWLPWQRHLSSRFGNFRSRSRVSIALFVPALRPSSSNREKYPILLLLPVKYVETFSWTFIFTPRQLTFSSHCLNKYVDRIPRQLTFSSHCLNRYDDRLDQPPIIPTVDETDFSVNRLCSTHTHTHTLEARTLFENL